MDTIAPGLAATAPVIVPAAAGSMAIVLTTASDAWHVPVVAWSITGSVATPILAIPVRVPSVVYIARGGQRLRKRQHGHVVAPSRMQRGRYRGPEAASPTRAGT